MLVAIDLKLSRIFFAIKCIDKLKLLARKNVNKLPVRIKTENGSSREIKEVKHFKIYWFSYGQFFLRSS